MTVTETRRKAVSVLVAAEVEEADGALAQAWLGAVVRDLLREGAEVTFVSGAVQRLPMHSTLEALGATVVSAPKTGSEDAALGETSYRHDAVSRQLTALGAQEDIDIVVAQGFSLCCDAASGGTLTQKLWSLIDDDPVMAAVLPERRVAELEHIATGSYRIVTTSEQQRSVVESRSRAATSKTRVAPMLELLLDQAPAPTEAPADRSVVVDLSLWGESPMPSARDITARAREQRRPVRLLVCGTAEAETGRREASALLDFPGAEIQSLPLLELSAESTADRVLIMPEDPAPALAEIGRQIAVARRMTVTTDVEGALLPGPGEELSPQTQDAGAASFASLLSETRTLRRRPTQDEQRKPRVVLAGSDFKFSGDLVDRLAVQDDFDVRVDRFVHHSRPQPWASRKYLEWADVIIAEFAAHNAIWYSQNVRPEQKLIVHLHGFELLSTWIDELEIHNVHRIVVASEFYRQRCLEMKDWPAEKVIVIPNSVNADDLDRPKLDGAQFHLALIGYVPILKRPDRALDVLEILLEHDDRYILHLKGNPPWNYVWEWKKAAHQDAYREFFRRIGRSPRLREHIAFEPFGPDMGNWLRKVGWVLSTSTRETFHMAAIEGARSGAVPVAWRREGAEEIIGGRFVHDSSEEIAKVILEANESRESFAALSQAARSHSDRYSADVVCNDQWFSLLDQASRDISDDGAEEVVASTMQGTKLYERVVADLDRGDTEAALSDLDAHVRVTAQEQGKLKDLELLCRGLVAADTRRFSLFLPPSNSQADSESEQITDPVDVLLVRGGGQMTARWSEYGLDRFAVDLDTPPGLQQPDTPPARLPDVQQDRGMAAVPAARGLRFDRWVHVAASDVAREAAARGISDLVVAGPWWAALTAAHAADRLGGRVHWIVTDDADISLVERAIQDPGSPDLSAQLARVVFLRADSRIRAVDGMSVLDRRFDLRLGDAAVHSDQDPAAFRHWILEATSQARVAAPAELLKQLGDLRLAVVADSATLRELQGLVKEVRPVEPEEPTKHLTADLDALIVFSSADQGGSWAGRLRRSTPDELLPAASMFDEARALGIPGCFVLEASRWDEPFYATMARRADHVSAVHRTALLQLLKRHPISVSTADYWEDTGSLQARLLRLLRSAGVPVSAQAEPRPMQRGSAVSTEDSRRLAKQLLAQWRTTEMPPLEEEKVSVIVATHSGGNRIPRLLESLGAQTFPEHLLEVIVVENGSDDGTRALVGEFADDHREMTVRYLHSPQADVGAAHNLGLMQVSGAYVAFADDDDRLDENCILSMWLSAGPDTLVIGGLVDEDATTGARSSDAPHDRRMKRLGHGSRSLSAHQHLLGMDTCKLVPVGALDGFLFPEGPGSGEDAVFSAHLLLQESLDLVPAAPLQDSAYVRSLRDGSVSLESLEADVHPRQ